MIEEISAKTEKKNWVKSSKLVMDSVRSLLIHFANFLHMYVGILPIKVTAIC